jgi:hypothetical protein
VIPDPHPRQAIRIIRLDQDRNDKQTEDKGVGICRSMYRLYEPAKIGKWLFEREVMGRDWQIHLTFGQQADSEHRV